MCLKAYYQSLRPILAAAGVCMCGTYILYIRTYNVHTVFIRAYVRMSYIVVAVQVCALHLVVIHLSL